jgi:hypothetical protein
VPHVPLSHPFVERLVGTMRREFLDHVLFWNARDLERKLADFQAYYNEAHRHASLEGHTPLTFASGHTVARAELNKVRWVSHCRDLVQLPLKAAAKAHGRSLQAEIHDVLRRANTRNLAETRRLSARWLRRLKSRSHSDSTALIREDRDSR